MSFALKLGGSFFKLPIILLNNIEYINHRNKNQYCKTLSPHKFKDNSYFVVEKQIFNTDYLLVFMISNSLTFFLIYSSKLEFS